ncbi:hypothetical protein GOBAR_AA01602 [Gossypium barbadense]|nr:hypothetical protein GOBAR_AA01602 [Gossypium barbadense]
MNNCGVGIGRKSEIVLKKGSWTAVEDAILVECVRSHGEGNRNAVQKNTRLARCGKSCRCRWANRLRPDCLKNRSFSAEENKIIIELHAMMGNKWAPLTTPPPLPSPSASTPPHISPLHSPHNPPSFPTLPLFDYPNITTDDDFFHSNKRFKHHGLQSNCYNNNHLDATSSSFTLLMQQYSNRMTLDLPSSSRAAFNHHPHQDSGCFSPLKTELRSKQIKDDGLLENMLQEAQALDANGRGGNKEMPKAMMNAAQNGEEDY